MAGWLEYSNAFVSSRIRKMSIINNDRVSRFCCISAQAIQLQSTNRGARLMAGCGDRARKTPACICCRCAQSLAAPMTRWKAANQRVAGWKFKWKWSGNRASGRIASINGLSICGSTDLPSPCPTPFAILSHAASQNHLLPSTGQD